MAAILFCRSQPKPMRGLDLKQNELFSYTTLEQRIPNDHPLRPLRGLVDTVLASMDRDFDGLYSTLDGPRLRRSGCCAPRCCR